MFSAVFPADPPAKGPLICANRLGGSRGPAFLPGPRRPPALLFMERPIFTELAVSMIVFHRLNSTLFYCADYGQCVAGAGEYLRLLGD